MRMGCPETAIVASSRSRFLGLPVDSGPENLVEVDLAKCLRPIGPIAALDVFDQLVDVKGVPSGFPCHHVSRSSRHGVVVSQKDERQLARFGLRQRLDRDFAVAQVSRPLRDRAANLAEKHALIGVFRAKTADQKQSR